jgi:glucokinase
MVYLTISTGVGGGAVIGGRLYRGAGGNGGELGHVTVDWRGRRCKSCGRLGCLEAYVSGTSIAERAREAGLDVASAEELAASAAANDALAARVWDETVEALACGVVSIVNLFEPELLVLGGGVTRSGDQLFVPLRERVAAGAMKPAGDVARIVPSAFGDLVGVVGAAAIVYDRAADERPSDR